MIEEAGRVVSVEGAFAWVETQRKTACGSCSARAGCGTSVLDKVFGQRMNRIRALNQTEAQVGDEVIIGLSESALVRGSFAVYAVPLVGLFVGAGLATALSGQAGAEGEGLAILGGVLGLAAGFLLVRRFSRRIQSDRNYQPVILRSALQPAGIKVSLHNPS
jgi:sigma-E factor negative regulatory protein RseC